ncbi:MAG TPA: VCBS repeat-containing protein, partial [Candidatus Angelobacter sp.]|nr:VCBS repeat-containing protein [Candidatus Angelobacter sp.]
MTISVSRSVSLSWKRVLACLASALLLLCLPAFAQSPRVDLQNGRALSANHSGDQAAVQALAAGRAQPVSMASEDVDADGVADLVVGYSAPGGGIVAVYRGNLDAFAPQSHASFLAIGRGEFPSPFRTDVRVFNVPVSPDFLAIGNFTGGGTPDLVMASRGGNAMYVFAGDGNGGFGAPKTINLQGAITALAAGNFGKSLATSVVLGLAGPNNSFSLSVYGGTPHGLAQPSSYPLNAAASSLAFGNLAGGSDIAVVSGGQVQIFSGSTRQLQTVSLPVDVSAVVLGSFIHDRNSGLQMALLASDGGIHIAAHSGFDPRAYTAGEAKALGLASMTAQSNAAAPVRTAPANQSWQIIESFASVAPFSGAELPVLLRSRVSGNSSDDVLAFSPAAGQMSVISHANPAAGAATFVPGGVSVSPNSGSPIAAISMRVNVNALPGVVLLHQGQLSPVIVPAPATHTYFVNDTADPAPAAVGTICNNTSAADLSSDCSLREAVIKSNNDGGSNTIMVAAGFYILTIGPPGGA